LRAAAWSWPCSEIDVLPRDGRRSDRFGGFALARQPLGHVALSARGRVQVVWSFWKSAWTDGLWPRASAYRFFSHWYFLLRACGADSSDTTRSSRCVAQVARRGVLGGRRAELRAGECGGWRRRLARLRRRQRASHYSPLTQTTAANVADLEEAWSYRSRGGGKARAFEATPLKIDDLIYVCCRTTTWSR